MFLYAACRLCTLMRQPSWVVVVIFSITWRDDVRTYVRTQNRTKSHYNSSAHRARCGSTLLPNPFFFVFDYLQRQLTAVETQPAAQKKLSVDRPILSSTPRGTPPPTSGKKSFRTPTYFLFIADRWRGGGGSVRFVRVAEREMVGGHLSDREAA